MKSSSKLNVRTLEPVTYILEFFKDILKKLPLRRGPNVYELLITINPNIHKNLEFSNYDDLKKKLPLKYALTQESGRRGVFLQEVDPNHNMLGLGHSCDEKADPAKIF